MIDALANGVIRLGGVLVIAAVVGILVFIVAESIPLFQGGSAHLRDQKVWPGFEAGQQPEAVGLDEFDEFAYGVHRGKGEVHFLRIKTWESALVLPVPDLEGQRITSAYRAPREDQLFLGTDGGVVLLVRAIFEADFNEGKRTIKPSLELLGTAKVSEEGSPVEHVAGRYVEGVIHFAAALGNGKLVVGKAEEGEVEITSVGGGSAEKLIGIAVDGEGDKLVALTERGNLVHWSLVAGTEAPVEIVSLSSATKKATSIEWVIGENSLLVGFSDGTVEVWSGVKKDSERPGQNFVKFYGFAHPLKGAVTQFAASSHSRGFLAASDQGDVVVGFTTSQKDDIRVEAGKGVRGIVYSPKLTGMMVLKEGAVTQFYDVNNPHPEITWKSLFGKVWYEGYAGPEYTWQSSSGADSFEAKFSLTPLLLGTVKGAFYGLLFAIPIAITAALYTSQFMHYKNRAIVKPTVEIMAAMPSVVVGFLAGLWLAPLLDKTTVAVLLMFPLVPLAILSGFVGWQSIPKQWRDKVSHGTELLVVVPAVVVGIYLAQLLAPSVEIWFFGGNFKQWIFEVFGQQVEQRNCVVIGLAMGFAVIPIIFTISEDAITNVPRHFTSGSLALGASRWQTATRVILPTASPGIFSAVMIGFGRAVGETMIVLMATGNTPIMSMSPFNGMRTLSANIAVEIPEAPVGGTHYRVLFVAAVLLFALTFVVNTAAEIVRQRLRDKFKAV
jgi:phosphate transport system permease protein